MDKMNTKVEEIDEQVEHGNRLEIILYPRAERTQIAQYVRYSMRDSSKRVHKKRVIEGYFDMVGMGDLVIFGEFDTNGKPLYDKDVCLVENEAIKSWRLINNNGNNP